jgi:methionyl aminopeptidase
MHRARRTRRDGIEILSEDELKLMRKAGLVVAHALEEMSSAAQAGMTTREVDAIAVEHLARSGATSSFLGYDGGLGVPPFPAVTCQSVNDEVIHGIPGERVLQEGDLLSIDFGASVGGYHGDAARTVCIGEVEPLVSKLSAATWEALWAGIGAAHLAGRVSDISAAVETSLRRHRRFGIVRNYTGHGIGHKMHLPPDIANYGPPGRGPTIRKGMCLAIEPMATLGTHRTEVAEDEWTVTTVDGTFGAHWENTVTVTAHGLWILTEIDGGAEELSQRGLPFGPLCD